MRDTELARGFLRGRAYKQIEAKRFTDPNWTNIFRMAQRYGAMDVRDTQQKFAQWKQEAGPISERRKKTRGGS